MEPFTHDFIMMADDRCQSYHYESQGEGFHAALQDRRSTGSMPSLPSIVDEQQAGSQLIQHAMDSISRVASAIEHAASLSRSAAAAFEEQVEYIQLCAHTGGSPLSDRRITAFSIVGADNRLQRKHRQADNRYESQHRAACVFVARVSSGGGATSSGHRGDSQAAPLSWPIGARRKQ